ncbi:branched-chain amino acid ABC transporter permease [Reyranella sp. CPCC 100927]|uniref:branched-chain amino acid ABC transporter permease n=1 Tax=Reyranella sp. CPCC 100927 TaxID=2599616 RepID=UPI0011B6C7B9|nr:branched-chain amino acid ABC transporter permease [Reyranella sp. CPCC 100927]TWT15788.1 branched-chain amino acid ABC transporter permease [Reyranella sp. CPCC 100927]
MPSAFKLFALAIGAVVLIALPFIADGIGMPAATTLATSMLIYGIAAASLNLALGYGGLVSFGHAAFLGLGGYVVGILYHHFVSGDPVFGWFAGTNQLIVSVPAAMLVCGLLAAAIGALSLRTSGVQFIMITLAFAQMLFFLFVSLKAYGGDDGLIIRRRNALPGLDTRDDTTFYFVCLAIAAVCWLLLQRFARSRFGVVLSGVRQSERRMAALGFTPYIYKLVAFIVSGMGTGLAGALLANHLRFVSPDTLHWTKSGELMVMVVLGGVGTLSGPWLGAAALVALEAILAAWSENWQIFLGLVLLVVVLLTRGGLDRLLRLLGRRSS